MTVHEWLTAAAQQLADAGIQTTRLDALVLLEDTLGHDRAWLLANPDTALDESQIGILDSQIAKRVEHVPLAYIRGKAEFYGRDFIVDEHVLVPRPESETIIELLKKYAPAGAAIADIGTGSGALAITAALELPESTVAAVDIDEACLAVTKRNAAIHTITLSLFAGDLLEPFLQENCGFKPDVLLCNLPYVPLEYPVNDAARHEPALALFGGSDGLGLFRTLFTQAETVRPEYIIAESLPEQHAALETIAADAAYMPVITDDFVQVFKVAK